MSTKIIKKKKIIEKKEIKSILKPNSYNDNFCPITQSQIDANKKYLKKELGPIYLSYNNPIIFGVHILTDRKKISNAGIMFTIKNNICYDGEVNETDDDIDGDEADDDSDDDNKKRVDEIKSKIGNIVYTVSQTYTPYMILRWNDGISGLKHSNSNAHSKGDIWICKNHCVLITHSFPDTPRKTSMKDDIITPTTYEPADGQTILMQDFTLLVFNRYGTGNDIAHDLLNCIANMNPLIYVNTLKHQFADYFNRQVDAHRKTVKAQRTEFKELAKTQDGIDRLKEKNPSDFYNIVTVKINNRVSFSSRSASFFGDKFTKKNVDVFSISPYAHIFTDAVVLSNRKAITTNKIEHFPDFNVIDATGVKMPQAKKSLKPLKHAETESHTKIVADRHPEKNRFYVSSSNNVISQRHRPSFGVYLKFFQINQFYMSHLVFKKVKHSLSPNPVPIPEGTQFSIKRKKVVKVVKKS